MSSPYTIYGYIVQYIGIDIHMLVGGFVFKYKCNNKQVPIAFVSLNLFIYFHLFDF